MSRVESDACLAEPRIANYQATMLDIHSQLASRDIDALKFLCCDIIPLGPLERCKHSLHIFEELRKQCLIGPPDNVNFLAELLYYIGRFDLLKKLKCTAKEVERNLLSDDKLSHVKPYRILLHSLCQDLTREECGELRFLCEQDNIPRGRLESVREPQDFFRVLESQHRLAADNVNFLLSKLRQLRRNDLVQKVEQFHRAHQPARSADDQKQKLSSSENTTVSLESAATSQPITRHFDYFQQPVVARRNEQERYDVKDRQRRPHDDDLQQLRQQFDFNQSSSSQSASVISDQQVICIGEGIYNIGLPEASTSAASRDDDMPCYSMTKKPRGICLIISNEFFYKRDEDTDCKQMENREGTKVDLKRLANTFQQLGFIIQILEDQTAEEMAQSLLEMTRIDHSHFDCFVCCILSHGALGSVYGVNGRTVSIRDLMSYVKAISCPTLRGKPKLFFIQACQGVEKQAGSNAHSDLETDSSEISTTETIPNEADFLLGLATVSGFVSYRSKTQGSWYITTLVRMLDQYASRYDLLSILTRVNEAVSRAYTKEGQFKQVPQPMFTLRKQIIFR